MSNQTDFIYYIIWDSDEWNWKIKGIFNDLKRTQIAFQDIKKELELNEESGYQKVI